MKILFANNFFGPFGGAEKVMWDEANLLLKEGHDVHFFATNRKPYFISDYENAHFFPAYVDLRNAPQLKKLFSFPHIFYNRQAEEYLERYLQVFKPDLVHIHNLHYHLTPSILAACQRQNIPVVMTLHDIRLLCPSASLTDNPAFKGLCNTGNPLICMQSKCKNGSFSETVASIAEYYMNRNQALYQTIQTFITPSAALLELMVQTGFSRDRFVHINNFIDPDFLEQADDITQDQGYFLYVGRLSSEKGVHYLLQALAQLPDVQLKIAGTGPQEAELKDLATTLNLSNVEFLGFQNKASLMELLRHCRATVLPCNWFENLPLSVLESLAFGRPVIASAVGGLPEILDQGRCGILVQPTNIQELVDALKSLHQDLKKAYALGQNGRIRIQSVYTHTQHLAQFLSLYEHTISKLVKY